MPPISILIPHKKEANNDQALRIALDCIAVNTRCDYELLVDTTTPANPYAVLNSLAARARGEYIVFSNSDIFVAPDWDVDMLAQAGRNRMVCPVLVEPGAIGVWAGNITRDYGMRPDTFRRAEFESFAASNPPIPDHEPFYYYCLLRRADFLADGLFDLTLGEFPFPVDIEYYKNWQAKGRAIVRAQSYWFHCQNWSNPAEQKKNVRWGLPE